MYYCLIKVYDSPEYCPFKNRANSATSDAQSTAAELGRDRDMRRNVPMGALLAPQPTA